MAKIRVYSFGAINTETGAMGTYYVGAKSADAAEDIRWNQIDGRGDNPQPSAKASPFVCNGYVGPVHSCGWMDDVPEFKDAELERIRGMLDGTGPRYEWKKNLLNPNGKGFVQAIGTPACCDPSTETYHSM